MPDAYRIWKEDKTTTVSIIRKKDGFCITSWDKGGMKGYAAPSVLSELNRQNEEIERLENMCLHLAPSDVVRCEACDGVFTYLGCSRDEDQCCYFCYECSQRLRELRQKARPSGEEARADV